MTELVNATYVKATITTADIEAGSEFLTLPRGNSTFAFVLNDRICNDLYSGNRYQNGNPWIRFEKPICKSEFQKVKLKKVISKSKFENDISKTEIENDNLKSKFENENESYEMKYPITPMRDVSAYYHNAQLSWGMFDCPHRLKEWCNKYFPHMANREVKVDYDYMKQLTTFDELTLLTLLREIKYLNVIFISPNQLAHIFDEKNGNVGRKLKQLEKHGVLVYDKVERSRYRIVVNPLVASKQDGLMADYIEWCKVKCSPIPAMPSGNSSKGKFLIKNKYGMDAVELLLNPPECSPITSITADTSMLNDNYIEELDMYTKSNSKEIVDRICKASTIDYKLWMNNRITLKELGDNFTGHTYKA